ncbi:MAG: hypothetical protein EOO46_17905 [Flavobacterium sp.]|nr:MAG: hypothetical protein EOO46_17905 [Flavobacterium sp.]
METLELNTNKRKAAGNIVLPKAGLNSFDWAFVQGSTFVLRLNFCAKNPRLRQYPTRYLQCYGDLQTLKRSA